MIGRGRRNIQSPFHWPLATSPILPDKRAPMAQYKCHSNRPLSHKQRQLLELLAAGDTCKEAARQLGRSYSTIQRRIILLTSKFHARNTVQLVATAIRQGEI